MSKSNKVIISLGTLLIVAAALFFSLRDFSFLSFGDPVFTEEIPESRPKRLDRREMARFEGQSMKEILAVLAAEKAGGADSSSTGPSRSVEERLLQSLPDAPLPFPEDAEARDEEWLRNFVTSMKQNDTDEPTAAELWNFNLALAALKISPSQLPEALRRNTRPALESDTLSVHFVEQTEDLTGQFAVGDFDGEPGLEVIDQGGARMNKLTASGNFIPVEGSLTLFPGSGVYPADFDQDGDLDLYLTRSDGFPDSLLRNQGKGQFEDITSEAGLLAFRDSTAASWIDYDVDGLPDLLVGSKDQPLELYHQTAGGTFQPVAWDLKLWVPRGIREIKTADFSGDGFPDFYLGIDGLADRLCANRPAEIWTDWRFLNIIADSGLDRIKNGSITFLDFNSDGKFDFLFRSDEDEGNQALSLFENQGNLSFENVTDAVGLNRLDASSACGVVDLDNDGFEDLVIGTPELTMNRVFWNRGGIAFREITVASGAGYLDEPIRFRSCDLDQNGASDLLYLARSGEVRRLEANGSLNSWIQLVLKESTPGMLLRLEVRDADWIVHTIEKAVNDEAVLSIGLGDVDVIETLAVFLPGEEKPLRSFEKVEPNQQFLIELPERPAKRPVVPLGDS